MADDNTPQSTGNSGSGNSGNPPAPASSLRVRVLHPLSPNQPFRSLPPPTGKPPYHFSLNTVVSDAQIAAINAAGRLVFHIGGDTGGVKAPQAQQIVAMHMESDLAASSGAEQPAFFYHLGDVVYYYGEAANYYSQFYEPYMQYPLPILPIPGNHDGDVLDASVPSLAAFVENFCATDPHLTPEAGDATRMALTLPNVYWTLEAPFVTIIGLYTNVPEGGRLDNDQIAWFASELSGAPTDKALIVAMHHPIYSGDIYHTGSEYMAGILDQAIQQTGRVPDIVFAGHVHNYQRFTRAFNGRDIPYIVAGASGYWHLHYMQKVNGQLPQVPYAVPGMDATLESYCEDRHGFMRLEVTADTLKGTYFAVPRPQESWRGPSTTIDSFTLDLKQHKLL